MHRNRLAAESSPYLLQHAENPVDWYPWGEEAFAAAAQADKPVLLSVGYSACHWCHVMAHESFEDPGVAALMNELFINVKVDREERPDLDRIYQTAQQLITQRPGGWPLTLFLTPADRRPFFGGTYFPKEPRQGMPGFPEVLRRVAGYFQTHAADIRRQNAQLALAFERLSPGEPAGETALGPAPLLAARQLLERDFDARFGGFGPAPKFPQAPSIERCLRHWCSSARDTDPDLKALYMATLTLTRMAEGGIHDQLGGGFARYSVDAAWRIPHFEKMLYDNGQLLTVLARAALATGEPLFLRAAGDTADWMLREMRAPEGGFYSSIDADSEGHEGRFYVWSREEIQALLTPEEFGAAARRFGLDEAPNFEGLWHLQGHESLESLDAGAGGAAALVEAARAKLLRARNLRIRPARDEKVLTSWNALAIKGMAVAGRVLNRPDLIEAAAAAVDFIHRRLWREGRLLAAYKDGRAHLPAYLDDYAFLADALLELLQSRWRSSDLDFARELIEVLLDRFEDKRAGGFYFTASDHERLIHRSRSFDDDAMPSGNAVAASVMCRLGCLLGDLRYLDAAERILVAAWPLLTEYPRAHLSALNALEDFLGPLQLLIIRGDSASASTWAREVGALYAPTRMIFAIPGNAAGLPPGLAEKRMLKGTTAYLCTGMTCGPPLTDLADLARRLAS